jgi:hypothetical protein
VRCTDSPLLQLAWIAEKVHEWTDLPVDRDQLLTTVSLYWFTGSGATAAHTLYEQAHSSDWGRAACRTAGLRGLRRRRDGTQVGPGTGRRVLDRVPARQALHGDGSPDSAGGGPAGVLRSAGVTEVLSLRGLNRATPGRQYLLDREAARRTLAGKPHVVCRSIRCCLL